MQLQATICRCSWMRRGYVFDPNPCVDAKRGGPPWMGIRLASASGWDGARLLSAERLLDGLVRCCIVIVERPGVALHEYVDALAGALRDQRRVARGPQAERNPRVPKVVRDVRERRADASRREREVPR